MDNEFYHAKHGQISSKSVKTNLTESRTWLFYYETCS